MLGVEPFAAAVADHQEGRRRHPCVIERDDGFVTTEDLEPYLARASDWSRQEEDALGRVGKRVLDIGCGPGRHLLDLQEGRFAVGLDISAEILKVCRERGGRLLVRGSSSRLPFRASVFDTVLAMSNGLGISGGMDATKRMLLDVGRVIDGEGYFISHTMDPTNTESGIDEAYRLRNVAAGKPAGLLRLRIIYGHMVGPWFELLVLDPLEVRQLLLQATFDLQESIEWEGSMIYIARREL